MAWYVTESMVCVDGTTVPIAAISSLQVTMRRRLRLFSGLVLAMFYMLTSGDTNFNLLLAIMAGTAVLFWLFQPEYALHARLAGGGELTCRAPRLAPVEELKSSLEAALNHRARFYQEGGHA